MTDLLIGKGYIITNKYILTKLGTDASILLGELCSEYAYWFKEGKLLNDYFFSTRNNLLKNTGLTKYKQRKASKTLMKAGIIIEEPRGVLPTLLWYKIDINKLQKIIYMGEELEKETLDLSMKKLKS